MIVMTVDTITVKGGVGVPLEVTHTIVTVIKASGKTMLIDYSLIYFMCTRLQVKSF